MEMGMDVEMGMVMTTVVVMAMVMEAKIYFSNDFCSVTARLARSNAAMN